MIILEAFVIAFISVPFIHCTVLVPERANVTEVNKDYTVYAKMYVTRTSRKSPYFMNIEGQNKVPWGNNVTRSITVSKKANIYFYEYLHNEYRRSFVEVHARLCDFMHKDIFLGKVLLDTGVSCPVPVGEYHFLNLTFPMQNFPYKFPFYKFRAELNMKLTDSNVFLFKGYFNAVFKNK